MPREGAARRSNSLVAVDPFGIIRAFHDKRHLVPLVEAPLFGFLPVRWFDRGGRVSVVTLLDGDSITLFDGIGASR